MNFIVVKIFDINVNNILYKYVKLMFIFILSKYPTFMNTILTDVVCTSVWYSVVILR